MIGPYVLLEKLGSGGMGAVYRARPGESITGLPDDLVVKTMHEALFDQSNFLRRFRHEAEVAVGIDSPHVAKVFDVGAEGRTLFMAMELIDGWPLNHVCTQTIVAGERIPPEVAVDIIDDVLHGLAAVHEAQHPRTGERLDFVHRDLSPKNVMLGRDGRARLIDLGLGQSRLQDWATATGVVMGTPGYMSPEQAYGRRPDQRSDLYCIGLILFELLTQRPYIDRVGLADMLRASAQPDRRRVSEYRPDLSSAFDDLLDQVLAVDIDRRLNNAGEVSSRLRQIVPTGSRRQVEALINAVLDDQPLTARTLPGVVAAADRTLVRRPPTEVYARRPMIVERAPTAFDPAEEAAPTRVTVQDTDLHQFDPTRPVIAPSVAPPPRAGVPPLVAGALVIVALAVGVIVEREFMQPTPTAARPQEVPSAPRARPAAIASPDVPIPPVVRAIPAAPEADTTDARRPTPVTKTVPEAPKTTRIAKPPSSAPPRASRVEQIRKLLVRSAALRATVDTPGDRAELDRLRGRLLDGVRSEDALPEGEIGEIRRAVDRLEAR